jgi:hypothetical protein
VKGGWGVLELLFTTIKSWLWEFGKTTHFPSNFMERIINKNKGKDAETDTNDDQIEVGIIDWDVAHSERN